MEEISAGRGVISFKVNRKLLVQVCLTELFHCEKMNSIEFSYSVFCVFQKVLEPFGKGQDEKFGLNSELLSTLKRGTTLVEYRYV